MTLKDAISAAGGFTDFAYERIRLQHLDGSRQLFKWSAEHPLTNNAILRPGDNVINPRQ
jgi:protein involved in polysaccharide export with SLBB domain